MNSALHSISWHHYNFYFKVQSLTTINYFLSTRQQPVRFQLPETWTPASIKDMYLALTTWYVNHVNELCKFKEVS